MHFGRGISDKKRTIGGVSEFLVDLLPEYKNNNNNKKEKLGPVMRDKDINILCDCRSMASCFGTIVTKLLGDCEVGGVRCGGTCLEMSPQYHSASCSAMLLFIPLLVTGVGLGGFGGKATRQRQNKTKLSVNIISVISHMPTTLNIQN